VPFRIDGLHEPVPSAEHAALRQPPFDPEDSSCAAI
jgi:hypothetical protein